ncbi:hypothetical protein Pelo_19349 [Pelomyxa schiedti]|nr:hypothetical protein Pelo_19349 [Pelomyxa schiedti]
MFPLVALASRAVAVGPSPTRYRELGHYRDLEHAAAALSPKCVAWIIANNAKNRRERRRQAARVGSLLAIPQSSTGGTTSSTNDNITTSDWDGDVDNNEEMEEEIGWMMRREREWVAVLTGLCCGGHLGMAKMFLGSRWEGGVVWPKEGVVAQQQLTAQRTTVGNSLVDTTCVDIFVTQLPGGGALLCDEFWSERGMWNLVRRVCAAGHLEVLQWVLTDVLQLTRTELVGEPLLQAALNGHLHIFKWLVSTFDLDGPANSAGVAGSFHPTKGRVSDVKSLVETFPHWDFRLGESVQYLADSAAFCKECSSDEIIEIT